MASDALGPGQAPLLGFGPVSIGERVETAQSFVAAGRFNEAEALLTEVLQQSPGHAEALCAFGAVALARRQLDKADRVLSDAATAYPDHVGIICNLGLAHQMSGRLDEAIICFERACALAPADTPALLALGNARFANGDCEAAREITHALLALAPDDASAMSLLGAIAMALDAPAEAEHWLLRSLELRPNAMDSLHRLSVFYLDRGRFDEALHLAERAQVAAPLDVRNLGQLAQCLAATGRFAEAEKACRKILAFAPGHSGAREILSRVLVATGRADAGIAELSKAVRADPKNVDALLALAGTVRFAGRAEQALTFIEHALKLEPGHSRASELREELRLALGQLPPSPAEAAAPIAQVRVPNRLPANEFIVLARFLADLGKPEAPITIGADEQFTPLLARLRGHIAWVPPAEVEGGVALPSLLPTIGIEADRSGEAIPYVAARPEARQRWLGALTEHPRPWIGVLWEHNPLGLSMSAVRSCLPGAGSHISLMAGEARHDLKAWLEAIDAGRHLAELDDLISIVDCLDAIIGPDVPALHLAGALGKPGVVLVSAGFPWYWASRGEHSLWYPSIRVARQERVGDWQAAIASARAALRQWQAPGGSAELA